MYYVYIIQSINAPEKVYVGSTKNIDARLKTHNNGGSIYTKNYKPWKQIVHICFEEKNQALYFEKYLKSQSGRAFLKKRLIS